MKILMVNNQLNVLGGSETYMFSVGEELKRRGHDVQYFGQPDSIGKHGNRYDIYAKKSINPFSAIKNKHNVRQFAKLLDAFKPDIVHLNLIYFVLTPEIICEAKKRNIPIIQTVHDPKIVCPNHRLYIERKEEPCTRCLESGFKNCILNRCIKNSRFLSAIALKEAERYMNSGVYQKIDRYIFPSEFMKKIHISQGINENKSVVIRNFSRISNSRSLVHDSLKEKYVLYFGRLSVEKGMRVLLNTIKQTPNINYKIVGNGYFAEQFKKMPNCTVIGFLSGDDLTSVISNAALCVFPSIWYENCPMSLLESLMLGTPVLGSDIGGIPELIDNGITGCIFKSNDANSLRSAICEYYFDDSKLSQMRKNCMLLCKVDDVVKYVDKLEKQYFELKVS